MSSFEDLLGAFESNAPKPDAPDAVKWFNDFSSWLETDYLKLQKDRTPGLHASELFRVCPRRSLLEAMFKPDKEIIKAGQQATFDVGHALHWWWQHRYLGPKGELLGNWKCVACGTTVNGQMPLNCKCGADWRDSMSYQELGVKDPVLEYTGHADGVLLDKKSGIKRIFEFKTTSPSEFKELVKPKLSHIMQAHAYMRILGPSETLVLYQNKGSQCEWSFGPDGIKPGKLNIKVFIIKFDKMLWKEVEDRIVTDKKIRAEIKALIDSGNRVSVDMIEKSDRMCNSMKDDAAKYCPVADWCFKMGAHGKPPSIQGESM